jgi:hypothetical protein
MAELFMGLTDIAMSLDGDIMLDETGDIGLVQGWDFLFREVNKRIRTNNPSWKTHPSIGVTLRDFIGHPNTPATSQALRKRIREKLSIDNIGFPGEFDVIITPTGRDSVDISIEFYVGGMKTELTKIIYDFKNGVVQEVSDQVVIRTDTPVENRKYNIAKKSTALKPNKYQDVINTRN